jgi:lipoprotein-releasing system permease protein
MSVMNGFRAELLSRTLGFNSHLSVYPAEGVLLDYGKLAARLRAVPQVVAATPLVEGQVMVTTEEQAWGALVRGMRIEDLKARPLIAGNIRSGSLDAVDDDAVVVGSRLAQRLGLKAGDNITLISPKSNMSAFGPVPRLKTYRIGATFEAGMYEYDSSVVFMPLEAAQLFFRTGEGVSDLEVFVTDPDRIREVRRAILTSIGERVRLVDWQQRNFSIFNAIQVERNVMFLILTLIIVVAAFNIISSMIMLVKDKGRDIAILRTMGATRGMILRVFLLTGVSIGVTGTLLGFALGVAFADNIETIRRFIQSLIGTELFSAELYFFTQIPARIEPAEVATVVGMALALSFLATIYPSWRAARLDPVEALRYE